MNILLGAVCSFGSSKIASKYLIRYKLLIIASLKIYFLTICDESSSCVNEFTVCWSCAYNTWNKIYALNPESSY